LKHYFVTAGVIGVTTLAITVGAGGSAVGATPHGQHHRTNVGSHPSGAATSRTTTPTTPVRTTPVTSVGLMDAGNDLTQATSAVSVGPPTALGVLSGATSDVEGTAITGSGNSALVGDDDGNVFPVKHLRTDPTYRTPIDLSAFTGEGGSGYNFYSEGVAIGHHFALVGSDSQGIVQLLRSGASWKIDTRVQSSGLNAAGNPHLPGFIAFPTTTPTAATEYNSVVIAPRALPNGKYLAVSIDRSDNTLAVIEGVGTATPTVTSTLTDPSLAGNNDETGTSDMTFVPTSSDRVVLGTPTGVEVLNLTNPAAPTVQAATTVGTADDIDSIAVSPDGTHVAAGVGPTTYLLKGLLAAATSGTPMTADGSITLNTDPNEAVFSVAFTRNGTLSVQHGNATNGYALTLVKEATSGTPVAGASATVTEPDNNDSLSVWPALSRKHYRPHHLLLHGRVGRHVSKKLSILGGVGTYTFAIAKGKLAKGLKLRGATVVGTPTKVMNGSVTFTATNQLGGTVTRTYKEHVHHKRK
jgi:hypothetical protein